MDDVKHTGLWTVDEVEYSTSSPSMFEVRDDCDEMVAACKDEANARLIAAAPDLLAVCERFLAAQRMAETDGRAGFGLYAEAIDAAEAAVKKARGET